MGTEQCTNQREAYGGFLRVCVFDVHVWDLLLKGEMLSWAWMWFILWEVGGIISSKEYCLFQNFITAHKSIRKLSFHLFGYFPPILDWMWSHIIEFLSFVQSLQKILLTCLLSINNVTDFVVWLCCFLFICLVDWIAACDYTQHFCIRTTTLLWLMWNKCFGVLFVPKFALLWWIVSWFFVLSLVFHCWLSDHWPEEGEKKNLCFI